MTTAAIAEPSTPSFRMWSARPQRPASVVRRPALVQRLADPAAPPLVVLVAPAGYGKTYAAARMGQARRAPVRVGDGGRARQRPRTAGRLGGARDRRDGRRRHRRALRPRRRRRPRAASARRTRRARGGRERPAAARAARRGLAPRAPAARGADARAAARDRDRPARPRDDPDRGGAAPRRRRPPARSRHAGRAAPAHRGMARRAGAGRGVPRRTRQPAEPRALRRRRPARRRLRARRAARRAAGRRARVRRPDLCRRHADRSALRCAARPDATRPPCSGRWPGTASRSRVDRTGERYRYHRLVRDSLRAELRQREPELEPGSTAGRARGTRRRGTSIARCSTRWPPETIASRATWSGTTSRRTSPTAAPPWWSDG